MLALLLASASPRRRALLEGAGLAFRIAAADVDERWSRLRPGAPPEEAARALALRKALAAAALASEDALVLGADTIVVAPEGDLLAKAAGLAEARAMLARLSGRTHRVVTGVALVRAGTGRARTLAVSSDVRFRDLAEDDLARYLESGLWRGKAGAYGVQDAPTPVAETRGSVTNVVGLPLEETLALIAEEARP